MMILKAGSNSSPGRALTTHGKKSGDALDADISLKTESGDVTL